MARIWTEPFRSDEIPFEYQPHCTEACSMLDPKYMLMFNVALFTFKFVSAQQIRDCRAYYEQKIRPSSRLALVAADSWEMQRWFERLPMYLLEEPKRRKVVKALDRALKMAESGTFSSR
jgi:hypothetical protein